MFMHDGSTWHRANLPHPVRQPSRIVAAKGLWLVRGRHFFATIPPPDPAPGPRSAIRCSASLRRWPRPTPGIDVPRPCSPAWRETSAAQPVPRTGDGG